MGSKSIADQLLLELSVHIVAIVWIDADKATKRERELVLSGTLVSVAGRWFILTAGHILRDLDAVLAQRDFVHCDLYGNWKSEYTEDGKIAFNYPSCPRWYLYDKDIGYDYGLIGIGEYYHAHLVKIGMSPVSERHVIDLPPNLRKHILVGMPSEYVVSEADRHIEGRIGAVTVANTLLPVMPVSDPPPELIKPHNRFYGRVAAPDEVRRGALAVSDVDGMSGGPIFGFGERQPGNVDYWIVGVQSGWHRPTRVIAACPLEEVFRLLRKKYNDFDRSLDNAK
jgi:hypothetical protein